MKNSFKKSGVIKFLNKYKIVRISQFLLGLFLFSVAFNFFLLPNNLVFGGVSGLSILFKDLCDPSMFVLFASICLLLVSLIFKARDKA